MHVNKVITFGLLAMFALPLSADDSSADASRAALSIQLEDIRSKMFFLATDEMGGRLVGTREHDIAANYIASEFMAMGLKPLGDNKSYFQEFDVASAWPDESKGMILEAVINGQRKSFQRGHDFDAWWVQSVNSETAQGPVEFLGYGINAPEYGYNDFAGINLRGKLALVIAREPQADEPTSKFRGAWDTYHAYDWFKIEEVRKAGAAGLLIVNPQFEFRESRVPSAPPNYTLPEPKYGMGEHLWDLPVFMITPEVADELLSGSGKTLASLQKEIDLSLKPNSFELKGVSVRAEKNFKISTLLKGRNVIGVLEGSDPNLKNEYVVVSGHYDHVGTNSTRIYRGADDNASGVVGTLEIAQAFVRSGLKPKRSIIFVCFDAEEEGLFGSAYYILHSPVPLAQTVANLNMDMIGRDEESVTWHNTAEQNRNMVNIVGTLYDPEIRQVIEQENQTVGLKLDFKTDTRDPDQWFARSDHFWFATRSIPQVLFNTGEQNDYHTENDTWTRINYPKMTKIVQLIFLTTDQVANAAQKPKFIP
jgi:hypothetical protein